MEKVSVIVPFHNLEKYITDAVLSMMNQTYKNIEIILVNDGSTDCSGELCLKMAAGDNRIVYLEEKKSGVSAARNLGLAHSTGAYIMFLDGDDEYEPSMVEKLVSLINQENADISCCGYKNIKPAGTVSTLPALRTMDNYQACKALLNDLGFFPAIWNKCYRRDIIFETDVLFLEFPADMVAGEDRAWISAVLKKAKKVVCLQEPLYLWKRREGSATAPASLDCISKAELSEFASYRMTYENIPYDDLRRIILRRSLGLARNVLIKARVTDDEKNYQYTLQYIEAEKGKYPYIDLFKIKLAITMILGKQNTPKFLLKKLL